MNSETQRHGTTKENALPALGTVCGEAALCIACYRRRRYSARVFGGNRDSVLERDGRAFRGCYARDYLNVHHRWRGDHTP
jgi:hypothetical protein